MPLLEITLRGHLLVAGGQATDLGVDLSTARRYDGRDWIPYIPATALRGAVRLQLEALLRGTAAPATGPYPAERDPGPVDPVCRLFGYSGPLRERAGSLEGALRFGDALPVDSGAVLRALAVRPGLEIDDALASAAQAKLFFREVAEVAQESLVFKAPLEVHGAGEADLLLLRAAIETTEAIGAGKSSGGGALSIRWLDERDSPGATLAGTASTATRARLTLTLTEPAHFGDGGPLGNHHATRKHIPGATVRGALAWALLRSGRVTAESPKFRALFLDEQAPVSFGDALLLAEGEPAVQPATRRKRRGPEKVYDDVLVRELARDRVNPTLLSRGLYVRADDGDDRFDPALPRPEEGLLRRTRTRVSIDRFQGASADGRLFSIEQVEPWLLEKKGDGEPAEAPEAEVESAPARPVRFLSLVEGPAPSAPSPIRYLELLADLPVFVGAGRNHGLGQVELAVRFEPEPASAGLAERVRALGEAVESCAQRLARRAGLPSPGEGLGVRLLPLALVALADYLPSSPHHSHPLAEPALTSAGFAGLQPARAFLHPGSSGGYDQTPSRAPLKELIPAVGAGSVFVYGVEAERLQQVLAVLFPALRRGVGRRVESGCGRFGLFDSTS
jgi:CRISPR-associated protein Csx10